MKLEWRCYQAEKSLSIWIQYTSVTDRRTGRQNRPTTSTGLTHSTATNPQMAGNLQRSSDPWVGAEVLAASLPKNFALCSRSFSFGLSGSPVTPPPPWVIPHKIPGPSLQTQFFVFIQPSTRRTLSIGRIPPPRQSPLITFKRTPGKIYQMLRFMTGASLNRNTVLPIGICGWTLKSPSSVCVCVFACVCACV